MTIAVLSALLAVAPEGEEALAVAAGAGRAVVDVLGEDAGPLELGARRHPQVDVLAPRTVDDQPREVAERLAEGGGHLGSDLEAAGADARTDGRDETAASARARRRSEMAHALVDDARFDATPAGMRRDDPAGRGIRDEDRDAIGDADGDGMSGARLGRKRVRFERERGGRVTSRDEQVRAVDLHRLMEQAGIDPDGRRETGLIFA